MAYNRNYKSRGKSTTYPKKQYTQAERLAFKMGQEDKVLEGLNNPESRVYEAYCKGYNGKPASSKKTLF